MSTAYDKRAFAEEFEQLRRFRRDYDDAITAEIQAAAGSSLVTRAPITGPGWPVRADYPNRAAYRKACAEWRRSSR